MIYLTKYMVENYLEEAGIRVKILGKEPWRFDSFSADLPTGLPDRMKPGTLYLAKSPKEESRGQGAQKNRQNACLLRIADANDFDKMRGEQEEIVCCGKKEEIVQTVLACFAFYKDWYLALQEELLNGSGLQKLVDLSVPVFQNPIAVSDIGFQVLAFTKEYHRQMKDAESRFICQYGVHSPAYIQQIMHQKSFLENLERNIGPFRYHYTFLQHESIYCTIWLRGKPVGLLTVVGKNSVRRRSAMDEVGIFSRILSKAFELQHGKKKKLSMQESLAVRVLEGEINDKSVIQSLFSDFKLKEEAGFYVVCVRMKKKLRMGQEFLMDKAKMLIESKLKKGAVLPDENGLNLVTAADEHWFDMLDAVVGMVFSDNVNWIGFSHQGKHAEQIRELYRQAQAAAEEAQRLDIRSGYAYERCMLRDILKHDLTMEQKQAAVHPGLRALKENTAQTVLYQTLRTYLMTEGDSARAAEGLHIHKNTLYYRLHQVEEILHISLEDREIRECLRASVYLLELCCA